MFLVKYVFLAEGAVREGNYYHGHGSFGTGMYRYVNDDNG
jgi:hypothetical protein